MLQTATAKTLFTQAYLHLKLFAWQIVTGLLVLAFVVVEVRPFDKNRAFDEQSIASAWAESIGRLGIEPVYPPDEDLYVGDLWAVIVSSKDQSLLNRAVRVGHIDLRAQIISEKKDLPLFSDTPKISLDEKYRNLSRTEDVKQSSDTDRISLSLAAFPGVTITQTKKASGGLGKFFGAGREEQDTEEIRIPVAETYGLSAREAQLRFQEWCLKDENKNYCKTDDSIRALLAYAISPDVLHRSNGRYDIEVRLQLVTRVYLMREIEHQRARKSISDLAVQTDSAAPTNTSAVTDSSRKIALSQSNDSGISLTEVFQRPLVFGYRSLAAELQSSPDSKTETKP